MRRIQPITIGFVFVPTALILFQSTRLVGVVLVGCSIVILTLRSWHRLGNDLAKQTLSTQWHVDDPAGAAADAIPLAAELLAVVVQPAGVIESEPSAVDSWLAANSDRVKAVSIPGLAFALSVISASLLDAAGAFDLDEPHWASFRDRFASDMRLDWRGTHRPGARHLELRCSELLDRLREDRTGLVMASPAIGWGYAHDPLRVALVTAAALVARQELRDTEALTELSRTYLDALT
jgi:hypothetical protein